MSATPEYGNDEAARDVNLLSNKERARQIQVYVDLGYPQMLRMTPEAYAASIPEAPRQPAEYQGRLDVAVLIDPRVIQVSELLGRAFNIHPGSSEIFNQPLASLDFTQNSPDQPTAPYFAWMNNPVNVPDSDSRSQEIGLELSRHADLATILEVVTFALMYPELHRESEVLAAEGSAWPYADKSRPTNISPGLQKLRGGGHKNVKIVAQERNASWVIPLYRGREISTALKPA